MGPPLRCPALPLQVMNHADTAYAFGIIDGVQRIRATTMQLEIAQLLWAGDVRLHPNALAPSQRACLLAICQQQRQTGRAFRQHHLLATG